MNRKGFTLIELLIVVVIIGILAAIAIPKFADTKNKAYIASVKSDLRNLATAQESYFSDNATYAAATASLTNYGTSKGVVVTITSGDSLGWSAKGTHNSVSDQQCTIWYGDVSHTVAGTQEGAPTCAAAAAVAP